ncbi:MAG: GNAT family N-acetyltransferase [Candidatus Thiodiazotropha endolucinida]
MSPTCTFETSRLLIKEWHSLTSEEWPEQDLAAAVACMLTEPVTKSLPPGWQRSYTTERAKLWIEERDQEGTTLLVVERSERMAVGLVILFESSEEGSGGDELRLGYLLAEVAWGKGLATELLLGFVEWCKQNKVASVVGGVERENVASQRVLEKAGFVCSQGEGEVGSEELIYRLNLRS